MKKSFEEATGIDVALIRKSSGQTFAQNQARHPKGDV
jgi:iron(III) transport system substrate-binding protein